jgi:SH3 domain-containing YSC84-like protein 1
MRGMVLPAVGLVVMLLTVPAVAHADRTGPEQRLVDEAARTVERMRADPGLARSGLLRRAKAVFIMPSEQIGGTVVSLDPGPGLLLGRRDGAWSDPAFYNVAFLSAPHGNGGNAGPLVLLLMSDEAVRRFLDSSDVSVGPPDGLAVAEAAAGRDETGGADVVEWGGAAGGFSDTRVSLSGIAQNSASDRDYYGREIDAKKILDGKVANPGADQLRRRLSEPG